MTGTPVHDDPLAMPLSGLRLVEASAGTGKTFSLTGLYLRLLMEKHLDVRDILVMTFTRAATQELRARIRARLAAAARLAADPRQATGSAEDQFIMARITEAGEPAEVLARRLRDAAARMDEATITTIHGFSHQAVAEHAFDSAVPFDRGEQVDDREIHAEVVADYWRGQVVGRDPAECAAFVDRWPSPASLLADLKELLNMPHLRLFGPEPESARAQIRAAQAAWQRHAPVMRARLEALDPERDFRARSRLRVEVEAAGGMAVLLDRIEGAVNAGRVGRVQKELELLSAGTLPGQLKGDAAREGVDEAHAALIEALLAVPGLQRQLALADALTAVIGIMAERKRSRRQYSFDDMIRALHAAVHDPHGGPALVAALRRRWPWALVDEFQDTDPVQYDILRAVYRGFADGGLIMIGDPKQAIYGFRGGDVFAYLEAAHDVAGRYSLNRNFRSTAGVLQAVESLFAMAPERPFMIEDIRFQPVAAGRTPEDRVILDGDRPLPSLTLWHLPLAEGQGPHGKSRAQGLLARATVAEISRLLDPSHGVGVRDAEGAQRPLRPGDICVLVNSNREAADFQVRLARQGIPAACLHQSSVFASEQATEMLHVLRAVAAPADGRLARGALITDLFGLRLGELLRLAADDLRWQSWLDRLQQAHRRWDQYGVLAMLEPLIQEAAARILGYEDGERRMTNWLHLAERLQAVEGDCFGMSGLIHWLAQQIGDDAEGEAAEEAQLRLESDERLVRIATVHRVKGLQFPVVMLPYAPMMGTVGEPGKPPLRFHDDRGRAWLDPVGMPEEDNARRAIRERRAESLRVFYVAVTRAEQALYLPWGYINQAQYSPLAWLLHQADGATDDNWPTVKAARWFNGATVQARLRELAERGDGVVRLETVSPERLDAERLPPPDPPGGKARDDLPEPRPAWQLLSFSALVRGERAAPASDSGVDDEMVPEGDRIPVEPELQGLAGTGFGSAVHDILETADFADWPPPEADPGDRRRADIARRLLHRGLPVTADTAGRRQLDAVAGLVARALHTPLPEIGPLAAVPVEQRLAEMGFALRLGGGAAGRLVDLLQASGYPGALPAEHRARALRGLMQGFIDLLVERDGRYWVLDYKTNQLGPERQDYAPGRLAEAVRRGHYDLQYLIYLVALHRHLGLRLPGYDPDRHLGGVQYLFLRGMDGRSDATGVFVDRPPATLIKALDRLLDAREEAADG